MWWRAVVSSRLIGLLWGGLHLEGDHAPLPRRQGRDTLADGRDLAALVLEPDVALHEALAVLQVLVGHLPLAPGGVAHVVEPARLVLETAQETVVPDPVGHQ